MNYKIDLSFEELSNIVLALELADSLVAIETFTNIKENILDQMLGIENKTI